MKTRKAVITAAGRGTRMFPATRSVQKELLPLIDPAGIAKPTLQIICEECLAAGIEEICIVVEKGGQAPFRQHFAPLTPDEERGLKGKEWALAEAERLADLAQRITYVEQPSPEGFGHAVYQAKDFVGDESFVLLLGDHVYTVPENTPRVITQMLNASAHSGGSVTSVRLEAERDVTVTGIVKGSAIRTDIAPDAFGQIYTINQLQEKPNLEEVKALTTPGVPMGYYLGHFGIHLFTKEIFDCLGHLIESNIRVKNEFQLTSGQSLLLERSQRGDAPPYTALLLDGQRWDIGLPDEYIKTFAAYGPQG
jgi:UTP--glucose-1-phosphate uridylyltransferase